MEIEVLGKKYEVLEIIPKKHTEYDLFVCKSPVGYRECFQRIDIGRELKTVRTSEPISWNNQEHEIIKEALRNGKTATEISKFESLNRHTQCAIYVRANELKSKMNTWKEVEEEKRRGPRFKVRF